MGKIEASKSPTDRLNGSNVRLIITPAHVAVLDPPVSELMPVLHYGVHSFEMGGATGVRERAETMRCCDLDVNDRVCFPAGLVRGIVSVLRDRGYRVNIDDQRRPNPRMQLDTAVVAIAEPTVRAMLTIMAHETLGQIEVGSRDDLIERMVALMDGFPTARFAVAEATRRRAWSLWRM